MKNKLLFLTSLMVLKTSSILAYHDTGHTGGASLPTYETPAGTISYVVIPFVFSTLLINELMQLYLARRYSSTSLKHAEDYTAYTLTGSAAVVFFSLFTSSFHSLSQIPTISYAGLMASMFVAVVALRHREKIREIIGEIR